MMDLKWKLVCVDLDWTLCEVWWWWDKEWCLNAIPIKHRIDKINQMVRDWVHIIIYTARNMDMIKETTAWLMLNNVIYHWIAMQRKPWADVYLDDRAINADDFFKDVD